MLAADKLQLQSALQQQAVSLKEKEFNLHHSNLMTVGTQAAVLAGLDITMLIEFQPPNIYDNDHRYNTWYEKTLFGGGSDSNSGSADNYAAGNMVGDSGDDDEDAQHRQRILTVLAVTYYVLPRIFKFMYYVSITCAICANVRVVASTTFLSVLGAGLALRGPNNSSMLHATDVLYEERAHVFYQFGLGLSLTLFGMLIAAWLLFWPQHVETAICCNAVCIYTGYALYKHFMSVYNKLVFDERDTVDFHDLLSMNPMSGNNNSRRSTPQKKKLRRRRNSQQNSSGNNNNNSGLWSSTTGDHDEEHDDHDDDDDDEHLSNSSYYSSDQQQEDLEMQQLNHRRGDGTTTSRRRRQTRQKNGVDYEPIQTV